MEDLGDLAKILKCAPESSAFKTKLVNESLYLEMEDLGHFAKILKCAPEFLSLQNIDKTKLLRLCICKWNWTL